MHGIIMKERRAAVEAAPRARRPNLAIRGVFFFGLLFHYGGAFIMQLEYQGNVHSTSKFLQIIYLLLGLFGVAMLLTSPKPAQQIVARCRPIFYLVALAFASVLWSTSIGMTLKTCFAFLLTTAFTLALPARLGDDALPFLIRAMAFACLLSIIWVFAFPDTAVHHAFDAVQSVHAGLWRGIFSHKQSLGTFSGFTIGLILFYGRMAFPNLLVRAGALACAVICLSGSQSATGFVIAVVLTLLLYITYAIAKLPRNARKGAFVAFLVVALIVFAFFKLGALSFIPGLLGKSENLSGRGDTWQLVTNNFAAAGARMIFGGGFGSDFSATIATGLPIDSGYFEILLQFGYAGALLLIVIFTRIFLAASRLLIQTRREYVALAVFPISMFLTLMIYYVTETGLMDRHIATIFIVLSVHIIASKRLPVSARADETRMRPGLAMKPGPMSLQGMESSSL
jgi:exopolysaccharide production protein ExoQ